MHRLRLVVLWLAFRPVPGWIRNAQENGPLAVRVQPADQAEQGTWITLPHYQEIGSPAISPNSESIAFDVYKERLGNSRPEIWVARRDGSELKKLANGAAPRWSRNRKRRLFMRESVEVVSSCNANFRQGRAAGSVYEGLLARA